MKIIYFIAFLNYIVILLSCKSNNANIITYLKNNSLECIKSDYPGNQFIDGRFINDGTNTYQFSFSEVIKWKLSSNPQKKEKRNDTFKLQTIKNDSFYNDKADMIIWLGQSSFFIRIDGKSILTDPCLTNPIFIPRRCDLPCRIEDIIGIDYILISHNHLDHLDSTTLKKLNLKNTLALLPLGLSPLVRSFNEDVSVQEASWYQKYDTGKESIEIFFMPAKHFSNRSLWDYNESLWGSFIIKGKNKTIYFGGDSAYSDYYSEISQFFLNIDICLLPIGAYSPKSVMKDVHMSPVESVQAFNDLKGKILIPHHYGTFDTTDEQMGEPLMLLNNLEKEKKVNGQVRILNVGEIFYL